MPHSDLVQKLRDLSVVRPDVRNEDELRELLKGGRGDDRNPHAAAEGGRAVSRLLVAQSSQGQRLSELRQSRRQASRRVRHCLAPAGAELSRAGLISTHLRRLYRRRSIDRPARPDSVARASLSNSENET